MELLLLRNFNWQSYQDYCCCSECHMVVSVTYAAHTCTVISHQVEAPLQVGNVKVSMKMLVIKQQEVAQHRQGYPSCHRWHTSQGTSAAYQTFCYQCNDSLSEYCVSSARGLIATHGFTSTLTLAECSVLHVLKQQVLTWPAWRAVLRTHSFRRVFSIGRRHLRIQKPPKDICAYDFS